MGSCFQLLITLGVLLVLTASIPAADKNGVSPNTISLPKGPGSIEGLGESFQPALNSGTARYGVALKLPPGTAGHAPELRLAYESGSGNGPLGLGWQLPIPFIQRRTDHGVPTYGEAVGVPRQDTFINEAKEELVPQADGFFFCKNEGAFIRYRHLDGHWEATRPDGTRLVFGRSHAARIQDAVRSRVFAWLLEQEIDTHGNVILYSYEALPGPENAQQKYLTEVRYGPGSPPWTDFHFARFLYEDRRDWFEDCRPGFPVRTGKRLRRIDVSTQGPALAGHQVGDFNADGIRDHLVRAYELGYLASTEAPSHASLLTTVRLIGADGTNALPASTFGYSVCDPPEELSAAGQELAPANQPPFLFDNPLVDLVDLNGDGLPDLLKTGGPSHQAFVNLGERTVAGTRVVRWSDPLEVTAENEEAWASQLDAESTHLADMNGDGLADLVHKAGPREVFYFQNTGRLGWNQRQPMALENFPPPAPFGDVDVRTADLDFDKRIDLVRGDGLQYQVWFNRGSNSYSDRITLPNEAPVDFALAGVHLADFNGDRLPDVCRIHPLTLEIQASLGYGKLLDPVAVTVPDWTLDANQIAKAKLTDINADGLVDLVLERAEPGVLWYWLNLGNYTLAPRRRITGMPVPTSPAAETRWADLNGNGTTDLIYADRFSQPGLRAVDLGELLNCGAAVNSLQAISNGIGRITLIGYQPSTRFALKDAAAGQPWPDLMPVPVTVVASVTNLDSLGHSYRTDFRYHDGYYDAAEKQFRGFARVEQIDIGDPTAPTLVTRSHFDTGRSFEAMKGKLLRLTTETEDGRVFNDDFTSWQLPPRVLRTGTNGQTVSYAHPTGTTNLIKELAQGVERRLQSAMSYDDLGNQTMNADYGIVEDGTRSAFNDERIKVTEFAINTNLWILRTPARQEIRDENGAVVSRTEHFYDDETFSGDNFGVVTVGNATLKREWISPANSTATIESSRTRYDAYGNAVVVLDPLAAASGGQAFSTGHAREITYDARFHTYPVTETIHLGHSQPALVFQAAYDEGFGVLTSSTDFNANNTRYGYDTFARLTSLVKPGDVPAYPTVEYDYALAVAADLGDAPLQHRSAGVVNFIEIRQLDKTPGTAGTKRNHYFISRQFVDGLGRKLMTRTEAEPAPGSSAPRLVVTEATLFNTRQKPVRILNPFFSFQGGSLDELLAFERIEAPGWHGQFHSQEGFVALELAAAHAIQTDYDATLRPTHAANPDGTVRRTVYEPLVTRSFDENDADPTSPHHDTPVVHSHDGLGRLTRVDEITRCRDDGLPAETLRSWSTRYDYDLNDQLTRITDSQDNVKTFVYDGLKRRLTMNDPDRGVMRFVHDAASNLIETTDAKGQRITYAYDGANRILSEDYHDDSQPFSAGLAHRIGDPISGTNRPDVAYFYDSPVPNLDQGDTTTATARNTRGSLTAVWDLSGEEHTSYDARGRVEWVVKRIPDPKASPNPPHCSASPLVSYKTAFAYDSLDRLTTLTYPDADQLRYTYNDRNLLQSIPGGLPDAQAQPGDILSNLLYLPSGQMAQIDYGNGVRTTYVYDSRLRLKTLLTVSPSSTLNSPLIDFAYDFDAVSNIKSIEDRRPGSVVPEGDSRRNTQLFEYDDLYRLTRVQYSFGLPESTDLTHRIAVGSGVRIDGEINHRYDRIGNMLAQTSTLDHQEQGLPVANLGQMDSGGSAGRWHRQGRVANDPPGPHALTRIAHSQAPIPSRHYPYDANGNMLGIDGLTNTWDFKDRLVAVENAEMRATYAYDHTGRRITKHVAWKTDAPRSSEAGGPGKQGITAVTYVNKYFEVREHDAPTKYVWNGPTRVARVTGSLTTNRRVQRLRVRPGWNLCSLAVSGVLSAAPVEGHGGVVALAFQWIPTAQEWQPVTLGASLAAGTVLWLQATTNASLTITGTYTQPTNRTLTASGDFLPGAGLEVIPLPENRVGMRAEVSLRVFDSAARQWLSWLPPPLTLASDSPAFIAPGEAVFARADAPAQLEVPESALRTRYYHQDHLGSTSVITDGAGDIVEEVASYPFGQTRHSLRPRRVRESFGFTQKEQDFESGLHYFEARFQAAVLARFARLDPLAADLPEEWLLQPQTLHLYAYGGNNPIRYRDPTGQFLETAWDAASLAMGIVSIKSWDENTSFLEKALDVGGVALDTAAILVPFVPGGVGAALKAGKLATKADDLVDATKAIQSLDKAGDVAKSQKVVVIGENMKRVESYAKKNGAEIYPGMPGFKEGLEKEAKEHNRGWIRKQKEEGAKVIDIGPDFARRRIEGKGRAAYEMERTETTGYEAYKKVFERKGRGDSVVRGFED